MTIALTLILATITSLSPLGDQVPSDLSGRWVREATSRPAQEDMAPAWEEITVEAAQVSIRRAAQPRLVEVYQFDGVDRQTTRTRASRICRAGWNGATLTVDCREVDGGPGGMAPPIVTREIRSIDAQGRMVVETHWSSGDQSTVRRERYRRQVQ